MHRYARITLRLRYAATTALTATVLASCAVSTTADPATPTPELTDPAPAQTVNVPVERAIDGDTIVVTDPTRGSLTVRLIGIDTPETKDPDAPVGCFGPQAATRTTELTAGQHVRLEHDPTQGDTDRYGRTLAYVWLPTGHLLNEKLLAGGYAREYTYRHQSYAYRDRFLAAEEVARTNATGLWGACPAR